MHQHSRRLDEIGATLADHTSRFDATDSRFDVMDSRFDRLEATVGQILEIVQDRDTR